MRFQAQTTATASPLVGTLTVELGTAWLQRPGESSRPCRKREALRLGDVVRVAPSGRALLTLASTQEIWRIPAETSIRLEARAFQLQQGKAPTRIARLATLQTDPGKKLPPHLASIIRTQSDSLRPLGTQRQRPLVLTWSPEPWAQTTILELFSTQGALLWKRSLPHGAPPSLTLPATHIREGVWYQVRLTQRGVRDASGITPEQIQEIPLRLLPTRQRQRLEAIEAPLRTQLAPEPSTRGLLLGDLYADYGLVSELPQALRLAFGPERDGGEAQWQLGRWLERAERRFEALAAYKRALERGIQSAELTQAIARLSKSLPGEG